MINNLKEKAISNNVPIITDDGLDFILDYIKNNNVKKVLEIGTAVGYSAISFAINGASVDTIERDLDMYKEALINVQEFNLENKIKLINADALLYEGINDKYDLIFIDGAKAQYKNFFEKYSKYLNKNGAIICDNLNFHNLDPNKVSRGTRQLLRKIDSFKEYLKENKKYKTTFYNVGDGMSVSVKNEENNNNI